MEALLALVMVLVSYTSGWSSLADVGIVPLLLPLLQDTSPTHVPLVSAGLRILEAMMDFSTTAVCVCGCAALLASPLISF